VTLALLNGCRFGYIYWGISHLVEVHEELHGRTEIGKNAISYAILPLGGIVGAYGTGWITDRFFAGRRAPVICVLLVLLSILTLIYVEIARTNVTGTIIILGLIGMAMLGPQVLLVGTAPADLARRETAAAAAGFVDFIGYVGAFASMVVSGFLIKHYGWHVAISVWALWAFAGACTAAFLWNARAGQEKASK